MQQTNDVGDLLHVEIGAQLAARDAALEQSHQADAPVLLGAATERAQMRRQRDRSPRD